MRMLRRSTRLDFDFGRQALGDAIPCILRPSLDAARLVTPQPDVHEQIMRDVLSWAGDIMVTSKGQHIGE